MKPAVTGHIFPGQKVGFVAENARSMIVTFLLRLATVLGSAFVALAACAAMSPTSAEMERLRIQIEVNPTPEAEVRYLALFPKTFADFTKIFSFQYLSPDYVMPDEELHKTHAEHLRLLEKLAAKHPRAVLDIWLSASINGQWDADAVGYLQHQLAAYAAKETKTFATQLMTKPDAQRGSIVTFLADVENHSAYEDYATILSNLEKLGQTKLRRLFLDAKAKRMKYRHAPGE